MLLSDEEAVDGRSSIKIVGVLVLFWCGAFVPFEKVRVEEAVDGRSSITIGGIEGGALKVLEKVIVEEALASSAEEEAVDGFCIRVFFVKVMVEAGGAGVRNIGKRGCPGCDWGDVETDCDLFIKLTEEATLFGGAGLEKVREEAGVGFAILGCGLVTTTVKGGLLFEGAFFGRAFLGGAGLKKVIVEVKAPGGFGLALCLLREWELGRADACKREGCVGARSIEVVTEERGGFFSLME